MIFKLSEDHEQIRALAREFAQKKVAPHAIEYDKSHEYPWPNIHAMAEAGWLGMTMPEEYGNIGADTLSHALVVEEISRACAATGVILEVHNSLHAETILHFGNEEQKARFLPDLATGRKLGGFALTEPGAGSDAAAQETTAVPAGSEYVVNGRKCFITSGGKAHLYILMAMTDKSKGTKGITAFVLEAGTPGLSYGLPEDKMGIRCSCTSDLILEDCRLPAANRLGNEGDGFKIAMAALDGGRIGIAAQALGIAQAALDAATAYAKQRVQFGKPIADLQAIQWKLAEMATDIDAARLMTYRAAWLKDQPGRWSKEIAMAKLFASDVAMRHTVEAVQIHGGYGYMRDYQVERYMRDAKITQIYEGTSEVMKLIIAASILR
ncbi:MAG: acyl-CoA dehydrogenase family protein [Bacillota bacterium]